MNIILYSILAMLAAILATQAYWAFETPEAFMKFYRLEPCDENRKLKTEFRVGETFFACRSGEVFVNTPRMAHQTIVNDDTRVVYIRKEPVMAQQTKVGKFDLGLRIVDLPPFLPPGNYSFRIVMTYRLNPLRQNEVFESPHTYFKIVK